MLDFYRESIEPTIFINAYVPLVRFYHDKYNLKCDMTLKNKVAFANTKLLAFFSKLDDRVIPLMMAIRYWAKHTEFIGKGMLFNTYTISLMLVYFLQSTVPPVLPDANYILSQSDKFHVEDMDDRSYLNVLKNISPTKNNQTLDDLLKDFFFFYLYFDFTRVICPLIGKSVPREEFFSAQKSKKFKMNSVCVQDPLCLEHNVAELVEYKVCRKFFQELLAVCNMFQDGSVSEPSDSPWGLMALFDKPANYRFQYMKIQKTISFTVPIFSSASRELLLISERAQISAETILKIMQDVLLFECRVLPPEEISSLLKIYDELAGKEQKIQDHLREQRRLITYPKRQKKLPKCFSNEGEVVFNELPLFEQFQNCNKEFEMVLCASCKALKNIWHGRNFVEIAHVPSSSLLERERLISLSAAKQNDELLSDADKKNQPFQFSYECYVCSNNSDVKLLINFRPLQKLSFNPILGTFLKDYIPKIVENLNKNA